MMPNYVDKLRRSLQNTWLKQVFCECREFYYLFSKKPHGLGYVLMLHRIGEPDALGLPQNESLKVSAQHLEQFIIEAKKVFDIIRIEELPERIRKKYKRKFIVFTFDDGFKEVLTTALPIFQRHGVPFTVFLTAGFPERESILWWEKLHELILSHDYIALSNGDEFQLRNREEKIDGFNRMSAVIKKLGKKTFAEELNYLFAGYDVDWYSDARFECLQWEDVKTLLSEPLFTLGSHTYNHYMLENLDSEESVRDEVMRAVEVIRSRTGHTATFFAYPYGGAGKREFKVMRSLENAIKLSLLAHGGPVTSVTNDVTHIPRENFDDGVSVRSLCHYRNVFMGF